MQTCPECGKTFDPADRATPPSPVKTYPHIQALLRRARWRASVRLHTRTADEGGRAHPRQRQLAPGAISSIMLNPLHRPQET